MPQNQKPIIGIIGSSVFNSAEAETAERVGKLLAENGFTIICGGLKGVMESACKGAKSANGITIGILPGTLSEDANPYVDIPIPTGIGEARNLVIIRTSSILIAIGGGYGTLSEIAFALRLSKHVIGLNTWDIAKISKEPFAIIKVTTPEEAVAKTLELVKLGTFVR